MAHKEFNQNEYPFGKLSITSKSYLRDGNYTLSVRLNSDILKEEVVLTVNEECIIIERLGIDYNGKARKFHYQGYGWYTNVLVNCDLEDGKYLIDEDESTFDKYVFYLENN